MKRPCCSAAFRLRVLAVLCALPAATLGCARQALSGERPPQAHYQTAHPTRDTSGDLERIFRSVKRIQVTGYYRTYRFAPHDSITRADLKLPATYRRAIEEFTFDHTRAGTATVISRTGRRVSLITNEHVTRVPDTVVVYFGGPADAGAPSGPRFVESVSVRTEQRNVVVGLGETESFRVVARDSAADIAVIGVNLSTDDVSGAPVLPVPRGDASRLRWGSFVYVLGYPRGFRMVTRAIASDPNRDRDNSFLLDGLFNRGISGGLVLAVRGDTEEFEWVGMAMAASAQHEFILLPDDTRVEEAGLLLPYDGRIHIERVTRIDYGITFTVPMTAINRFLRTNDLLAPPASSPRR